jgi:hypothetical protein
LVVNGSTTTINSTTLTADDVILTLGGDTAPASDDNKDRGIEFRWHNGTQAKVGFFGFDDSTGYFTFIPDATNTSEVFSGTQGDIQVSNLRSSNVITTGDVSANTVTAGGAYTTRITGTGSGAYIYFGTSGGSSLGQIGRFGSLMQFDSDTPFAFKYQGTDLVRITTAGNVGIGTTAPGAKLTVGPSFVTSVGLTVDSNSGTDSQLILRKTAAKAAHSVLAWDNDVYIGAGTYYNNGSWVHHNNTTNSQLLVMGPGTGVNWYTSSNNTSTWNVASNVTLWNDAGSWKSLVQSTASGNSSFTGGNLGVGTSSPAAPLEVVGTTSTAIFRNSTANSYGGIRIYNDQNSNGRALEIDYSGSTYASALVTNGPTGESAAIATTGAYPLVLGTSNTARVTILSGGNVGIGTASPSQKLDVAGHVASTSSGGNPNFRAVDGSIITKLQSQSVGDTTGAIGTESNHTLKLITNNTTRVTLDTSGNVGVGTTTPNSRLSINGSPTSDNTFTYLLNLLNTDGTLAAGMGAGISFGSNINTGGGNNIGHLSGIIGIKENATSGDYAGALTFWTRQNGAASAERVRISSAGNVGIGSTSPAYKLDVAGTIRSNTSLFTTNGTSATWDFTEISSTGTTSIYNAGGAESGISFRFDGTERVFFANGGNVGIGTSSPGYNLEISGAAATNGVARVGSIDYGSSTVLSVAPGVINFDAAGVVGGRFKINSSGKVGINNTTPTYTLDVGGPVRTNDWFYVDGSGYGIYNNANSLYFSSNSVGHWNISSNQTFAGLRLYSGGHTTTWRGHFYGDGTGQGLLDSSGNWQLMVDSSSRLRVYSGVYNIDSNTIRIQSPGGAVFTEGGGVTGAFKIKLPTAVYNSNTMMVFVVDIYNYDTGKSLRFRVGGYNYQDGNWYNVFAEQISDIQVGAYNVRFGSDGTSNCIWIGETNSSWSYPKVFVSEFLGGHSTFTSAWASGWAITRVASFDTVIVTRAAAVAVNTNNIATYGVSSITGTSNQVIASASTGAVTLSLPQNIHTSATPTFSTLTLGGDVLTFSGGGVSAYNTSTARIYNQAGIGPTVNGANFEVRTGSSGTLGFSVNGSQNAMVAGNLTVGTTSNNPNARLFVDTSINTDWSGTIALRYNVSGQTNSYYKGLAGTNINNGIARGLSIFNYDADSNLGIQFFPAAYPGMASPPTAAMVLNSAGNLGIGAASPGHKLEVSGNILATKVFVGTANASYDLYNNGTSYLNGAVTTGGTLSTGANLTVAGNLSVNSSGVNNIGNAVNASLRIGNTGDQAAVISNTRRANYGDVMFAKNLQGQASSDSYTTVATSAATGYAGFEARYGGVARILVGSGATTADAVVTPTAAATFDTSGTSIAGNLTVSGTTSTFGGTAANNSITVSRITTGPSSVALQAFTNAPAISSTSDTASGYTWNRLISNGSEIVRVHDANLAAISAVAGSGISVSGGIIAATNITAGASSKINWTSRAQLESPSNGIVKISSDAGSYPGYLNVGGIQSWDGVIALSVGTGTGHLTANANLTVTGNLIVNGTTTTVDSTTLTTKDPIVTLGGGSAGTAASSDDNKDRGIEFKWHNGTAAKTGFFGFDDSTGYFTFIPDATNTSEVFSGTVGDIDAGVYRGTGINVTGAITESSATDQAITLNATDSSWKYIGFQWAGSRRLYFGLDSAGAPIWGSDIANSTFQISGSGASLSIAGNTALHAGNYNSYALPLTGGTLTGDLRFNIGGGYGRVAYADNYHGLVLRGYPNNAAGAITAGDVTCLIQHSGDFRFYRTNGTLNNLVFQVNNGLMTQSASGTVQHVLNSTDSGSKEIVFQNNGSTVGYVWHSSTYVGMGGGNVNNSLFVNGGYVGIGVIGTATKLEVYDSTNAVTAIRVNNPNTGTAAHSSIQFANANSTNGAGIALFGSGYTTSGLYRQDGMYIYTNRGGGITLNVETNNPMYFATNNTERMRIDGSGNLGIGTASPSSKLDISTEASFNTSTPGTGKYGLHFSGQATANYATGITFTGGDAASTAAQAGIYVQGAGSYGTKMYFATTDNYTTGAQTRMMINHGGYVGINTVSPGYRLHVAGDGYFSSNLTSAGRISATGYTCELYLDSGASYSTITSYGSSTYRDLWIRTVSSSSEGLWVKTSGNVGIGTASPSSRLHLYNTSGDVELRMTADSSYNPIFRMTGENNGTGEGFMLTYVNAVGDTYFNNVYTGSTNAFHFQKGAYGSGTELVTIQNGGNVGIGTTSPGYKLEVNGSFAATTKSFVIKHPTKEGKKLRYGSLEGPENGVYVRGRLKGSNTIDLPDYWEKLVDPDSITVNLTPVGKHQKLYVESVSYKHVVVEKDGLFSGEIDCFYTVFAERIDVEKLQVEIDA